MSRGIRKDCANLDEGLPGVQCLFETIGLKDYVEQSLVVRDGGHDDLGTVNNASDG